MTGRGAAKQVDTLPNQRIETRLCISLRFEEPEAGVQALCMAL
jgi:hypothetical protein